MMPTADLKAKLKEMEEDPRLDPFNIVLARQKARVAVKEKLEQPTSKVKTTWTCKSDAILLPEPILLARQLFTCS